VNDDNLFHYYGQSTLNTLATSRFFKSLNAKKSLDHIVQQLLKTHAFVLIRSYLPITYL
jgi:hypothetical protein